MTNLARTISILGQPFVGARFSSTTCITPVASQFLVDNLMHTIIDLYRVRLRIFQLSFIAAKFDWCRYAWSINMNFMLGQRLQQHRLNGSLVQSNLQTYDQCCRIQYKEVCNNLEWVTCGRNRCIRNTFCKLVGHVRFCESNFWSAHLNAPIGTGVVECLAIMSTIQEPLVFSKDTHCQV